MHDKTRQRVYLTTLDEEQIDRYLPLSDDPELVSTMGWQPFAAGERERFLKAIQGAHPALLRRW